MIKIPFEDIVAKIKEKSSLSEAEILQMIDAKVAKLSGLVSREGAAHIIANELGVKVFENIPTSGKLQIKNILPGIRDVALTGVAIQVYETREFTVGAKQGKVASFLIGDETGRTRVVAWNTMAEALSGLKQGDTVKIKSGYVRERDGRTEIHLNERSEVIINPEGEKIELGAKRKKINEIKEDDNAVELLGTIVQVQDPRFFEVCPQCGRRARAERPEEGYRCEIHGIVEPRYSYLINIFLDDGTENIRVVCFKNQVQKLLAKTDSEVLEFKVMPEFFEQTRNQLLATALKVSGNVRKNTLFDTVEIIAQMVEPQKEQINELR